MKLHYTQLCEQSKREWMCCRFCFLMCTDVNCARRFVAFYGLSKKYNLDFWNTDRRYVVRTTLVRSTIVGRWNLDMKSTRSKTRRERIGLSSNGKKTENSTFGQYAIYHILAIYRYKKHIQLKHSNIFIRIHSIFFNYHLRTLWVVDLFPPLVDTQHLFVQ